MYPATREDFRGRATVVAINAEYPEGWFVQVLRVVADGEDVVSEVEVPMAGVGVFRVVSFWAVRSSQVVRAREYWTSLGGEAAPAWRQRHRELPGRRNVPVRSAFPFPGGKFTCAGRSSLDRGSVAWFTEVTSCSSGSDVF